MWIIRLFTSSSFRPEERHKDGDLELLKLLGSLSLTQKAPEDCSPHQPCGCHGDLCSVVLHLLLGVVKMQQDWQMQGLLWIPASVLRADPSSSSRRRGKPRGRAQRIGIGSELNWFRSAGGSGAESAQIFRRDLNTTEATAGPSCLGPNPG